MRALSPDARSLGALAWLVAALALTGTLLLAGGSATPPVQGPLRIGAILSETGRYTFVGKPGAQVLRALQQEWRGQVEFVVRDSSSDRQRALAAYQELAADESIIGVVGPATTDETLALIGVADQHKLVCLSISAADRSQPRSPWVFRLPITSYHMVFQIGDYLARHNLKRISVVSVASGFGKGGCAELERQGPDFGLTVCAQVTAPDRRLELAEARLLIRQAMQAKPQALLLWWSGEGAAMLTRAARAEGVEVPILHSGGIASPEFLASAGEAAEGVLFPGSPLLLVDQLPQEHPQKAAISEFISCLGRHPEVRLSTFAGYAWDGAQLLREAGQAARHNGPISPRQMRLRVRAYLENRRNRPATCGVFHFSPNDHNGLTHDSFHMLCVRKGAWARP